MAVSSSEVGNPTASSAVTSPTRGQAERRQRQRRELLEVWGWRTAIVLAFLAIWQWLPDIPHIRGALPFADPFFISSPVRAAKELNRLVFGAADVPVIWPPFFRTILTALIGVACATIIGAFSGLVLSDAPRLNRIVSPFLALLNAVPRIAIIPIILLVLGSSTRSDAATSFSVVFFIVFYAAFEGSCAIPAETIQNARLLGARRRTILWKVRWPFVLGWTIGTLPNAVAFGVVGSVTAEIFTGSAGIGQLLTVAIGTANADLTIAIVVVLAVASLILSLVATATRTWLLPWWEGA